MQGDNSRCVCSLALAGCCFSLPQDSGLEYTFIRVGEIVDGKEGGSVMVGNTTDNLPVEQVVRDDIIRLSAEAFMMENATNTVRTCKIGSVEGLCRYDDGVIAHAHLIPWKS